MANTIPKDVEALGIVLNAVKDLDDPQKRWVFASAMSNLGLTHVAAVTGSSFDAPAAGTPLHTPNSGTPNGTNLSPKEFLRLKAPKSDVQRIACLAFYLNHYRGQQHFKTTELTVLNTEAAGTKMSNPSQAANNAAKQNHYLAPAGAGKKQITSFGEEVVKALPNQEAVKAIKTVKPKRRKPAKRAKGNGTKK